MMGKWSVVRVEPGVMPLSDYLDRLVMMTAARVPRTSGHKFVTAANQLFPFYYRHLKRTRPHNDDLLILLGPSQSSLENELPGALDHQIVSVPLYPPMSREQYEAGSSIWPMVFHESRKEQVREDFDDHIASLVMSYFENMTREYEVSIINSDGDLISASDADLNHPLGHAVLMAIDKAAKVIEPPAYLCTDLVVFCRREPCLMCAMALLHSRVAAVVFESSREQDRPFSHPINLQSQPGLNHYYKVYCASRGEVN